MALTHCDLATPYGDIYLVAWRHQDITSTNIDFSSMESCGTHIRPVFYKITSISPGVNELMTHKPRGRWLIFIQTCENIFSIIMHCVKSKLPYASSLLSQNDSHSQPTHNCAVKLLTPEKFRSNFTSLFFKLVLRVDTFGTFRKIGLRWVPQSPIDDKSTLVQVMAWCRQATSHYLSQYWPRSISPYDINT